MASSVDSQRIVGCDEVHERHEQQRGIEDLGVLGLDERLAAIAPAAA
jgi:hypothetical protein